MANVGRNDPCPCGSGKKFKKCCSNKPPAPAAQSALKQVLATLNPASMAQKFESEPMSGLRLVVDRFRIDDSAVVDRLEELGRRQGEAVLFYEGTRWIGEVDLSIPEEIYLVTARESLGDLLRGRLEGLGGLTHVERHIDQMEALQEAAPSTPGIEFKKSFFKQWRDEPNEALEGLTPRQAAADPKARNRLQKLLQKLKDKEARLPEKERFSFTAIERSLGL